MIWDSTLVMALLDLAVITVSVVVLRALVRYSASRVRLVHSGGPLMIMLGVGITGLFYLTDLLLMLLMPGLAGPEAAMRLMTGLHLNARWIISLVAVSLIGLGFVRTLAAIERSNTALQRTQRMEVLGRVAAGVAHDFNNSLTVIAGSAELGKRELPQDHPARRAFDDILGAADSSAKLTQQLLATGKQLVLRPQPVDLNALIDEALPLLRRAVGPHATLRFQPSHELERADVDPHQLRQAVLNLVLNADEALRGEGVITIRTSRLHQAGSDPDVPGRVAVSVTDNGGGIRDEIREQIFEPFFTTKGAAGTGLGLSMVRGIAEQSGGGVLVDSAEGRGTTVCMILPASTRIVTPVAESPRRAQPGSETVLVVEDDAGVRNLAVRMLERAGYETIAAASADEAERHVRSGDRAIDLVLTDIEMPGGDGIELGSRLHAAGIDTTVVYMSGYGSRELRRQRLAPDTPLLEKPFSTEQLIGAVRRALDQPSAEIPTAG